MFLLEVDKLVEMIERPIFRYVWFCHLLIELQVSLTRKSFLSCISRHLHIRMLEADKDPLAEGSGTMLFQVLKSLLMIIPQSTCYNLLRNRLTSTSRFRQSAISFKAEDLDVDLSKETEQLVSRVLDVRQMHCASLWDTIRVESLESEASEGRKEEEKKQDDHEEGGDRRDWLGFSSKEEEHAARVRYLEEKRRRQGSGLIIEELGGQYKDFESMDIDSFEVNDFLPNREENESWKDYWARNGGGPGHAKKASKS
jgi:hypothetical protein